jgi:hypothetical protein
MLEEMLEPRLARAGQEAVRGIKSLAWTLPRNTEVLEFQQYTRKSNGGKLGNCMIPIFGSCSFYRGFIERGCKGKGMVSSTAPVRMWSTWNCPMLWPLGFEERHTERG